MRVRELLMLASLGRARVVAGAAGLDRDVRWAHVVDMPEPAPWVTAGQLLLTTGYGWPRGEHEELRQIAALSERGLAAIGIAVPGYLERFSPAARAEAERCDLPLIEIPWDIPFAQITEELHRSLLLAQREEIERSEAIHRALTRVAVDGSSLSDLARRLSELIGRSVTIENQDGKLLAFFDTDGDGDDARRETIAATQSPSSLISALDRLGHIDRIRTASAPVRIPEIPELGMSARVACPIRIGRDLAGYVWILEGDAPLGELDHRAAEHAALVAALQIAHQRELALVESRLGYASFLSLLEAPGATSALALERAQLLGFDPQIAHRVGIVALDEPLPIGREGVLRREKVIERLRRQLSLAGVSQPMLGALYNLIPFLLPEHVSLDAIEPALAGEDVRIVVGRAYAGADGAQRSYREARSLLDYERAPRVARYEDMLVPRVLLGDTRARETFLGDLFSPLGSRKSGAALRTAILAYADEAFHFGRTARRLHVHPNTLRYRLDRAAELTGLAFDDPDVRFRLQLASRLLDLRDQTLTGVGGEPY
jgi:purine catabolism regulator